VAEASIKWAGCSPSAKNAKWGRSERRGRKPLSTFHLEVYGEFCLLWGTFWQICVSRLYRMLLTKITGLTCPLTVLSLFACCT